MAKAPQKTGKTIRVGNEEWPLIDRGVPVAFVDLFSEARIVDSVFYMSLAQTIVDNQQPEAAVSARLRMSLSTAAAMHDAIGAVLAGAKQRFEAKKQ